MIIGSAVHLVFAVRGGRADENTWTVSLLAIVGGMGLVFARDSQASSEFIKKTNGKFESLQNEVAQVKSDTAKFNKPNVPKV